MPRVITNERELALKVVLQIMRCYATVSCIDRASIVVILLDATTGSRVERFNDRGFHELEFRKAVN